jgi:hypothetical protein
MAFRMAAAEVAAAVDYNFAADYSGDNFLGTFSSLFAKKQLSLNSPGFRCSTQIKSTNQIIRLINFYCSNILERKGRQR